MAPDDSLDRDSLSAQDGPPALPDRLASLLERLGETGLHFELNPQALLARVEVVQLFGRQRSPLEQGALDFVMAMRAHLSSLFVEEARSVTSDPPSSPRSALYARCALTFTAE